MQCKQLPNSPTHRPVDCANMLRLVTTSLCLYCQLAQTAPLVLTRPRSVIVQEENPLAINALYDLSVDISKVRKLRSWVLHQKLHPEAILCKPDQMEAQKKLWMSVCASQKDLVGIIEKFPASFFSSSSNHDNQKANIAYFQILHLKKHIISKLMASAPQSFSQPVEQNEQMIQTLQKTYLDLGGKQDNMKIWLRKPCRCNVGFTGDELLWLLSKLKGFVTELNPKNMRLTPIYSRETLGSTEAELRQIILQCPALLYYSVPILADRFKGLLTAGVSMEQIMETPTVLEVIMQIVQYCIQKLRSFGYDVRSGIMTPFLAIPSLNLTILS
uniref:Mitochondrial transcription termination factor 2 n=1 Tax=Cyprinus carpio TaxID=7962 RepID=A0A8C1I640_CYPCA